MKDIPIPSWIKWIADNKTAVGLGLGAITTGVLAWKALKIGKIVGETFGWFKGAKVLNKTLPAASKAIGGFSQALSTIAKGLGTGIWVASSVNGIGAVIQGINDLITTGELAEIRIGQAMESVGLGFAGLAIVMGNPIAMVAGSLLSLVGTIFKVTSETFYAEEASKRLAKAEKELAFATDEVTKTTKIYEEALKKQKEAALFAKEAKEELSQAQKDNGISIDQLLEKMDKESLKYEQLTPKQKAVFDAYEKNRAAQNKLKESTENVITANGNLQAALDKEVEKREEAQWKSLMHRATLAKEGDSYEELGRDIEMAWRKGEILTEEARKLMEMAMRDMSDEGKKTWKENIPSQINEGLDPNRYSGKLNRLKESFRNAWNSIKNFFGKGLKVDEPTGSIKISTSGGGSRNQKGAVYFPKLATGGIINYPNHGVVLGRAIGGESGAEGVIPLTDSQMMARLGEAIGRYIVVNANITTSLNGRTINRELRRIQNEENFALNGGL